MKPKYKNHFWLPLNGIYGMVVIICSRRSYADLSPKFSVQNKESVHLRALFVNSMHLYLLVSFLIVFINATLFFGITFKLGRN